MDWLSLTQTRCALLKTPFCYHVMAAETILKLQPHTQFLYFRLTYPKVSFLSLVKIYNDI